MPSPRPRVPGVAITNDVRHKVLMELRRRKIISEERTRGLLSWRHSGSSVFVGDPIFLAAFAVTPGFYLARAAAHGLASELAALGRAEGGTVLDRLRAPGSKK